MQQRGHLSGPDGCSFGCGLFRRVSFPLCPYVLSGLASAVAGTSQVQDGQGHRHLLGVPNFIELLSGRIGSPTRASITLAHGFMVVGRFCFEVLTLFHSDAQLSAQAHPKNPGGSQVQTQLSMNVELWSVTSVFRTAVTGARQNGSRRGC